MLYLDADIFTVFSSTMFKVEMQEFDLWQINFMLLYCNFLWKQKVFFPKLFQGVWLLARWLQAKRTSFCQFGHRNSSFQWFDQGSVNTSVALISRQVLLLSGLVEKMLILVRGDTYWQRNRFDKTPKCFPLNWWIVFLVQGGVFTIFPFVPLSAGDNWWRKQSHFVFKLADTLLSAIK